MPGFRLNWYYIGLDKNKLSNYYIGGPKKSFVRSSIIIINNLCNQILEIFYNEQKLNNMSKFKKKCRQ